MICERCDSSVSDDSRYCAQCGQSTLLANSAQAPADATLSGTATLALPANALATVRATSHLATPVAAAAAPLAIAPALSPLEAERLHVRLTQANLCRMRRDWSAAIDHCVAALEAQPGNATAHSLLSDIYRDQGKLDDAIQWARLAMDLKSSPADAAKLQKLEDERAHLMRQGDSRLMGSGLSRSMALAADGGLPTGTQNLMGMPPRKWLNGITTAAMIFVGSVLLVLAGLRYTRHDAPRAKFNSYASASNVYNGGLPPAALPVRSSGMVAAQTLSSGGLPPDLRGSASAPPRKPALPNLPTAPVLNVRPAAAPAPAAPALRSGGGMATPAAPAVSTSGDATALPDGMWIASVQFPESGNARVKIGTNLASPADLSVERRAAIVRNVYRAANRLFEKYDSVQQVSVTVATDPSDSLLFTAEVARAAALALNSESTPAAQLENALQLSRWAAPETTQNASAPANDGIPGVGP